MGLVRFATRAAGAAALAAFAMVACGCGTALADGSSPDYPGSVLHVSVTPPYVDHQPLDIVATGSNVVSDPSLGVSLDYGLDVFIVDPTKLPGPCQTSESAESTNITNNGGSGEQLTFEQLNEGASGPFSITVPVTLQGTGPLLVCAYSEYVSDDAAWASTEVTITSGLPAIETRPRITRSSSHLTCAAGTWSGDPTHFSYRWVLARGGRPVGQGRTLRVTARVRKHPVECAVTASNASGEATATSRAITVA